MFKHKGTLSRPPAISDHCLQKSEYEGANSQNYLQTSNNYLKHQTNQNVKTRTCRELALCGRQQV